MAQLTEKQKKKLREQLDNSRRSGVLKGNLESNNQSVQQVQEQRKEDIYVSTSTVPKKIQNKGVLSNNNTQRTSLATVNRTDNSTMMQRVQARYEANMQRQTNAILYKKQNTQMSSQQEAKENSWLFSTKKSNQPEQYQIKNIGNIRDNNKLYTPEQKYTANTSTLYKSPTAESVNDELVFNIANKDNAKERAKIVNSLVNSKKEQQKLYTKVENYARQIKAQKDAENINNDLKNGKIGSSVGHVAKGLPTGAVNTMLNIGGTIASLNPNMDDNMANTAKSLANQYAQTNAQIDNGIVRKAGTVSHTIGNMLPAMAVGGAVGTAGATGALASNAGGIVNAISSGTSSYLDTLDEEQTNKLNSFFTGVANGILTFGTEKVTGGNLITKGSLDDVVAKGISKKITNSGAQWLASKVYEFGGEIAEENLENLAGYLIDDLINNKKVSAEQIKEDFKRTSEDTFWTTLVLNALGLGGNTYNDVKNISNIQKANNEVIDNSNLSEEQKASLKRVAEKHNMTTEEVQNLINNPPQENLQQTTQNQATELANNEVINNNQQITQSQNKMAENGNVRQIEQNNKTGLKSYTKEDIDMYLKSENNIVDGVNGTLEKFAKEHYDENTKMAKKHLPRGKEKTMLLGRISDSVSKELNNLINSSGRFSKEYDLTNNNFILKENNIEHAYNEHGNEKEPGQLDVTPENYSKIREVLGQPEYIGLSDNNTKGNPTIYMAKKINGYSVAVEVVKDKSKQIYPETYYVFESNSKEWNDYIKNHKLKEAEAVQSTETMLQDNNVQNDTVEASFINNIIPQNAKNMQVQNENIANNQETLYNGVESEVDGNEIRRERMGESMQSNGILEKEESQYSEKGFRKLEQRAKSSTTQPTTEQQKLTESLNSKKEFRFFNGTENDIPAFASQTEPGVIYVNKNTIDNYKKQAQIMHHEILESEIAHNKEIRDISAKAIRAIVEDSNFEEQIDKFYSSEDDSIERTTENKYAIAKDILCDIYAERLTNDGLNYENILDLDSNIIIGDTLNEIENVLENSNESSFSMQEKHIDKYNKYKENIIKRNENAINNLISNKNDSIQNIEKSIKEKEKLLNSKKNKDTKVANNIKMQIETLKTRKEEIENMYNEKIDKFNEKVKKKLDIEVQKQMKKESREVLSKEIKPLLEGSETWQDKNKGIWYSRETAQRNIYDIVPNKEHADLINKTIFDPIQEHQANKTRAINELFEKINSLNLDKKKKYTYTENEDGKIIKLPTKNATTYKVDEATLAQLYIEKKITEEDLKKYDVDADKIKNTAQVFTEILDSLYEQMNETVVKYGYSPIGKIKNYFPHFSENKPDSVIGKISSLFGIDVTNQELPTEIAGRTENFKPGKTWNSNLLQRKTDKTDYDALKILERYIAGAEDIIHTTQDIQRLRQFQTDLRYRFSEKGIQDRINEISNNDELMPFEQEEAIENILSNKNNQLHQLSHFATWLDDYTNVLANKKNSGDREFEKNFSRNMYTTMSSIENRIASNTIGGNLSVSLTNIAPLAQAFGTTKASNVVIGMLETTINDLKGFSGKKDTSFVTNSDFLTNRFGTDRISKKKASENASDVLSAPMSAIDAFTAESIVRAKYRENLQEGMTEEDALKNADKYAKNLMADRSKGALPVIFNNKNPMSKLVTMFQVEPNNIVSNYLKDMPREAKSKTDLIWKASKLMASSYAFNTIIMAIRGGNEVLPDPIRFVSYLTKWLFEDDEEEREQAQSDMIEAIVGATPFASNVAGIFGLEDVGRVPISNAMPNIANMGTLFDDDVSDEYKKEMLIKEISKPLLYLGLPVAGAQLSKTIQGLATVQAGGSYKTNKEGERQLQFPVEKNIGNAIKAGIFGKYSLPSANQYIDSGFKSLNAEATKLYDETGIDYNILSDYINFSSESTVKDENEYSKYEDENGKVYWWDKNTQTMYDSDYKQTDIDRKILTKSSNKKQLVDYINDLNITDKQKVELYKYNIVSDVVNEDGISAQDEMDYMLKNGMSNKEYLQTYQKALDNNVTFPSQKTYDKLKEVDLSVSKYLDYEKDVLDRKLEETKEKIASDSDENISVNQLEKMKILQDKKYSSKEKDAIYSTFIQSKAKEGKTTEYEDLKEYYANNSVLGSKNYRAYDIIEQYIDYKIKASDKLDELRTNGTKTEEQNLSDEEKAQLLIDAKYTNPQTEALYVNVVASDTNKEKYEIVKQMNGGNKISTYLEYVLADKESDKEDDGTKNGKTISGTKKKKVVSAIQSTKLNEISKIYLLGTEYDLNTNTELSNYYKLKNYLKTQSESDQLRIVKTLKGKTEMKDGTYTW